MWPILLLADALESAASHDRNAVALAAGHRVTYGELDDAANALAFALLRRGVAPGDRVVTLLSGPEAVVAFWAAAKSGVVCVPIEPADLESGALLGHDARALLVDAELHGTFHHAVARASKVRAVIARGPFDAASATGVASYVSWETALSEEGAHGPPERSGVDLDDQWLARSTKGDARPFCALSQRALLARGGSLARGLSLGEKDSVGGDFSVPELAVACALSGASMRWAPAPKTKQRKPRTRSKGAGRQIWLDSAEEAPAGSVLVRVYGTTESGPIAAFPEGAEAGTVMPNVDVRVVDDHGQPVPPKVVGEIVVRSSGLFSNWVRGIEAPPAQQWRTGDTGMLDDAGRLYLMD